MIRTVIGVDGMMCPMCESHIADELRKAFPDAKKVSANRKNARLTIAAHSIGIPML